MPKFIVRFIPCGMLRDALGFLSEVLFSVSDRSSANICRSNYYSVFAVRSIIRERA